MTVQHHAVASLTAREPTRQSRDIPEPAPVPGTDFDLLPKGVFILTDRDLPAYDYSVRTRDGQDAGTVRLVLEDDPDRLGEHGNYGCELHEPYRGRGYAPQSITMLQSVAKGLGLKRMVMTCDADHVPARTVCERVGARRAGEVATAEGGGRKLRYVLDLD